MKPLKSVPEWLGPLIEREEWLYGMREEGDCVLYYSVTDYEILFEFSPRVVGDTIMS